MLSCNATGHVTVYCTKCKLVSFECACIDVAKKQTNVPVCRNCRVLLVRRPRVNRRAHQRRIGDRRLVDVGRT